MIKKTMKISEVIKKLTEFKKNLGDLPVFLQEDTEGNGFGTLNPDRCFYWTDNIDSTDKKKRILTIQPYEEHLWFDDLEEK